MQTVSISVCYFFVSDSGAVFAHVLQSNSVTLKGFYFNLCGYVVKLVRILFCTIYDQLSYYFSCSASFQPRCACLEWPPLFFSIVLLVSDFSRIYSESCYSLIESSAQHNLCLCSAVLESSMGSRCRALHKGRSIHLP